MFEKLAKFAAKQLDLDLAEITPDSTFESLGIDSLDIVEMIMDRRAACMVYQGKNYTPGAALEYLESSRRGCLCVSRAGGDRV